MPAFWNPRRVYAYLAMHRRFEPYDFVDSLAEEAGAADLPPEGAHLRISGFGFRAEAQGKTGFAALRIIRKDNPVLVHVLYTYLAVLSVLSALLLARFLTP
ncbi:MULTISPECIES: hypothetical protein [Streptomyces]|uniref:hypothetical protein n=1 Tax=Streptomyces TaxID=1883 RepID=UPI0022719717|nr:MULTISPECIES: hypothetical protein [unclassified Streptomyces]MCY0923294.1 hypothetical protein [Streptomyces sp. H27-G5]MCY0943963.1 hypothetical protein [Streptomyces sp. H34-AA3]MCY0956317.1 hypothetical protein [Streptomyces sp. H27-H5]MCZ4082337.1 hypothetical protein [Streptomyces sp. H34-S5]